MTTINVVKRNGEREPLDISKIQKAVEWACAGLDVSQAEIETESHIQFFDGITTRSIQQALINAAAGLVSVDRPDYTYAAARLLLQTVYKDVTGGEIVYPSLREYITHAVNTGRLNPAMVEFNFDVLQAAIKPERDLQFDFLGLKTLADRYLIREAVPNGANVKEAKIIEMPQHFWMRVAMGLSLNEHEPERWAIEFYNVLSSLEVVCSTPTLFNSGTPHSQMSSCYVNTIGDSIDGIYGTIHECANLSKYAGGIGTDWSRVRSAGDYIAGTSGTSSGVVPYLKVYNDTAVAVNQGGKRAGSFAPYLQPWHADFIDFIDLKKNSGDERRRAHDIFPAAWIPDLFMRRVKEGGVWHFFSPKDCPQLCDLYGLAFDREYIRLENEHPELIRGEVPASELWKRMLNSLFETGHPWITFKDEMNRRNPQAHMGVIRSSNLCTEIALVTDDENTAVCNLASINLAKINGNLNTHLERVVPIAMRMLDNVIDLNFYPSEKARNSNLNSRPVGLGMMGYMEALVKHGIDFESDEHLAAANEVAEKWSFEAIKASAYLAKERGAYPSYEGSSWSRYILPIDSAKPHTLFDLPLRCDWDGLRELIATYGMRNSNCMAIAPTATIANIAGTTATTEPVFSRVTEKRNISGVFKVIDSTLKYGSPELCKEAFEIDQRWVIKAAAVRQRFIDQSQSTNIFVDRAKITGPLLSELYMLAWELGLKSTYYLHSTNPNKERKTEVKSEPEVVGQFCTREMIESGCESCQ